MTDRQPETSWQQLAPQEYGFYVVITEINADNQSVILAPQGYEEEEEKVKVDRKKMESFKTKKDRSSFTIGDLLKDSMKESLSNIKE